MVRDNIVLEMIKEFQINTNQLIRPVFLIKIQLGIRRTYVSEKILPTEILFELTLFDKVKKI